MKQSQTEYTLESIRTNLKRYLTSAFPERDKQTLYYNIHVLESQSPKEAYNFCLHIAEQANTDVRYADLAIAFDYGDLKLQSMSKALANTDVLD